MRTRAQDRADTAPESSDSVALDEHRARLFIVLGGLFFLVSLFLLAGASVRVVSVQLSSGGLGEAEAIADVDPTLIWAILGGRRGMRRQAADPGTAPPTPASFATADAVTEQPLLQTLTLSPTPTARPTMTPTLRFTPEPTWTQPSPSATALATEAMMPTATPNPDALAEAPTATAMPWFEHRRPTRVPRLTPMPTAVRSPGP